MSQNKILPNCVGRLDSVTEAIREGNRELARTLLWNERSRLAEKVEAIDKERDRARRDLESVADFTEAIDLPDKWHRARRECGWNGRDDVAVSSRVEST